MKKPQISIMISITLIFAAFTLGFFLGRNFSRGDVLVSIPESTAAPETVHSPLPAVTMPSESEPLVVNINTADQEELMTLPGIGEVYAQRIIAYREDHGSYSAVEELLNVSGIGEKRLEAILDYVTVGG